MTLNELRTELKNRIAEQEQFKRAAEDIAEYQSSRFHDGKANGYEDALELLDELFHITSNGG